MDVAKNSRSRKERECVKRLCKVLQRHPQIKKVSSDIRPSNSSILRKEWNALTGGASLKLQPQIDILIEATQPKGIEKLICGIEVKYFEKTKNRFNWSFYAGLDEAIATLNYGLHHAALWHVFFPTITKKELRMYGLPFWGHIIKLNLPIEFTMLVDRESDFDVYNPVLINGQREPEYLCKLSELDITFKRPNPIFNEPLQIKLREILYAWWKKRDRFG